MSAKPNKFDPVVTYSNSDDQKALILKVNSGKSGIYRWKNLINGLTYIGSGTDLSRRLNLYYNLKYLTKSKMVICKALKKYKHSNFSL